MSYDQYYGKHCARFFGWLPASKRFKKVNSVKHLKYFTLCAEEALDIFLLEKEGVLQRDSNKELPNVYICECDTRVASKIFSLVRPPLKEAIFVGPLDSILTFQEDHHTKGRDLEDDDRNKFVREKLNFRRLFYRMKASFPFDIINFDTYGNLLNHTKDSNKRLFESLKKILEFQFNKQSFLMFITIPLSDIDQGHIAAFKSNLNRNIKAHADIKNALIEKYATDDFEKIEEKNRIVLGFSKAILSPLAKSYGWQTHHEGLYVYENYHHRFMLSSVVLFNKVEDYSDEKYISDILKVIKEMPNYYAYTVPFKHPEIVESIEKTIEYREKLRSLFSKE